MRKLKSDGLVITGSFGSLSFIRNLSNLIGKKSMGMSRSKVSAFVQHFMPYLSASFLFTVKHPVHRNRYVRLEKHRRQPHHECHRKFHFPFMLLNRNRILLCQLICTHHSLFPVNPRRDESGQTSGTSLHCLPIAWKASIAPLVLRLISPLIYQPPKLLYFAHCVLPRPRQSRICYPQSPRKVTGIPVTS